MVAFRVWLLSLSTMSPRCIHVGVCVRASFLLWLNHTPLLGETTFCLPFYPLMGTWVVSSPTLNGAAMNMHAHGPV